MRRAGGALGITILGGLLWSGPAQADTATYVFTGTEQAFIVPAGVTSVHVVAVGARGGTGTSDSHTGALGAESSADLTVTPGQLLYVEVGGLGVNGSLASGGAGGFNGGGAGGDGSGVGGTGGGGGGGASDVRTAARFAVGTLVSRLVIAGGGGSSGGGLLGADAGPAGLTGGSGGAGGSGSSGSGGAGGGGATQAMGGGPVSQMGSLGLGGPGGAASGTGTGGGGGGGAGLYGGGGGVGGTGMDSGGGGGGGGSSGVAAGISNFSIGPAGTGTPSVTFTFAVPPATVPAVPTGQRAAAIRKCKKKFPKGSKKRRRCIKHAKRLPV